MRKPVNNETRLINEIWNNTNKHLNEQATGPQIQYDIDSLDLSDYTPQEQAEIRKQLKAQNFSNLTKFIAKPESGKYVLGEPTEPIEPAPSIRYRPGPYDVDQKGLQKALRYNKNVVVDNKGKKNYVSDMAKAIGWEPPVETREPSVSKTEQPMDAAAREFKATEKYKKMMPGANWAELAADSLRKSNKEDNSGPTIEISAEDLEGDKEITVDMRGSLSKPKPASKDQPEFPYWGESPHGYDPTTPEDAKAAQEWRDRNNAQVAIKNLADRIADPLGIKKSLKNNNEMSRVTPTPPERPMDVAVDDWRETRANVPAQGSAPATELGGVEGFAPALSASEFEELGMGVSKPETTSKEPKFTPQQPDAGLRLPSTSTFTPASNEDIQKKFDDIMKKAEKLAAEEKAATPEERAKVAASAERLSKETSPQSIPYSERAGVDAPKRIAPYSVAHSKALDASIARNKQGLKSDVERAESLLSSTKTPSQFTKDLEKSIANAKQLLGDQSSQTKQPEQPKPSSDTKPTQTGRDAANVVPGSQMWGEMSSSERQAIRDRYARGEGPSLSIRYNKETGKFDEPGYGDQGQYGDIVKALNMNESVQNYCRFISEGKRKPTETSTSKKEVKTEPVKTEAKPRQRKPKTETTPKGGLFDTSEPSSTAPTTLTTSTPSPVTSSVVASRPVVSGEGLTRKPFHGGRSEVVASRPISSVPAPVVTTTKTSEQPVSGARQLGRDVRRVVTSPVTKGTLAGGIAGGLLATILSITSGQGQPQAKPSSTTGAEQMQPKPVNTENTPQAKQLFEPPPETDQKIKPKPPIFRF